ncbi:MAG: amidohydrolase family protein [Deltaproteobacteria bacterium]|nr:amidohydrolase family protein [Deltaproteobacteria bacterium]
MKTGKSSSLRDTPLTNIMIIDFHTHIFPDRIAAATIEAVCRRSDIQASSDGTVNSLLHSMSAAGIDISVVCSVATRPEQASSIIRWLSGIRQPGIIPLAPIHPGSPDIPDTLGQLKEQGFKGLKMHPDYQDFYVDDKRVYPLYEAAQSEGMFILFHAGLDRGLPNPVHGTPGRFAKVIKDFPHLCVIAAHMGGEDVYEETEERLIGRDIYMDTSFVLRKMPSDLLKRFFQRHPAERFLFATDSPWLDQKEELDFLLSLPFLTVDAKEKITGGNASKLLGL